ncbi:histidine phosphatase superfamily [Catenaria anguillulae PL171]|uniref:Histidine phosphatase superfamily n=1 Tax=Catenaria anguillulae PL171 TaxID=765915 RepID=A0A1Y2H680_9FUNG|nr:histidine phosphatase superfamily [Catenaria anguillulae PL171]
MYSIRRMSASMGATPPPSSSAAAGASPTTGVRVNTNASAATPLPTTFEQLEKTWGSTGSIPSTPAPIPFSAAPNTPLAMPVAAIDAREPRRDLVLNLILVRHAETDLNARRPRVVQGHLDTPLNAHGMKQSLLLSHRLSKLKVDYIYSSDLQRAHQTAQEVARPHGKPVLVDPRLREQHQGDLTGQPWSAAKSRLKQVDQTYEEYLGAHEGEPSDVVKERVVQSYIDIVEKHLLAPNRIVLPDRDESANYLVEQYGPATPISPLSRIHASKTGSTTPAKKLAPRVCTVVLVTHGGPIRHLISHLVTDLGFTYHPKVLKGHGKRSLNSNTTPKPMDPAHLPVEPRMTQFPHTTGVFHVRLTRRFIKATDEYDWTGHVVRYNCTAHLAGWKNWVMHSTEIPPGATAPAASAAAAAKADMKVVTGGNKASAVGPYRLVRVVKKDKKGNPIQHGGKKGAASRPDASPVVRAKNMGLKMFGKFIGGGVIAGSSGANAGGVDLEAGGNKGQPAGGSAAAAAAAEDKRKKSLGW